ncbi:MAG: hypothetical protein Q9227_008628 [Pyrenula ochraceoflavens]
MDDPSQTPEEKVCRPPLISVIDGWEEGPKWKILDQDRMEIIRNYHRQGFQNRIEAWVCGCSPCYKFWEKKLGSWPQSPEELVSIHRDEAKDLLESLDLKISLQRPAMEDTYLFRLFEHAHRLKVFGNDASYSILKMDDKLSAYDRDLDRIDEWLTKVQGLPNKVNWLRLKQPEPSHSSAPAPNVGEDDGDENWITDDEDFDDDDSNPENLSLDKIGDSSDPRAIAAFVKKLMEAAAGNPAF